MSKFLYLFWMTEKGAQPVSPETTAGTAPAAAAGPPGSIGVSCKSNAAGHPDYSAMTVATKLDVCSVGGHGALTLVVKGEGVDRVNLYLAGYHGAGSYALGGASTLARSSATPTRTSAPRPLPAAVR